MHTIQIVSPFDVGDCVIVTVTNNQAGARRKSYVFGVIVRINFEVRYNEGKQVHNSTYDIVDSSNKRYEGISISEMETMGYFVTHKKEMLKEVAESNKLFIRKEEKEE